MWCLLLAHSRSRFLSGVKVLVLVVNEVGQSMTEIQSKQMALCLNLLPNISSQQWIPQALRGLQIWDYFQLFLSYINIAFITSLDSTKISSYHSIIYAAAVIIQLSETKSISVLCIKTIRGMRPGQKWLVLLHHAAGIIHSSMEFELRFLNWVLI